MFEKICVVADGTNHGAKAQLLGGAFTKAFEADLITARPDPSSFDHARAKRLAAALPNAARQPSSGFPPPLVDASANSKRLMGRRFKAIADDIATSAYDLVVFGSQFEGESDAGVGATCERLARRCRTDALVIKQPERVDPSSPGNILVCIDGSPQSYAGLMAAIEIAKKFDKSIECTAVYDPYLHYTLFNGIVNVLTKEAEAVFKFKDQEKLHEEIIDTGLAKIYQAHLEIARQLAEEQGVRAEITLLDGKAFERILRLARKSQPWLLVMGRIGVHSDASMDIGAVAENLLRQAPCNVLMMSSTYVPRVDLRAEESIQWTPEAQAVMDRVPSFVKGVATTAVLRWAVEHGHSVITAKVINGAMGDLLPPAAAQAMGYVAEEVAIATDNLEVGNTYLCSTCGYAARDFRPVTCSVCKADGASFEEINRERLEGLGKLKQGALEVEEMFDGKHLTWTAEAKKIIRRVPSGFQRRRSKARIEKTARVRGLETVTADFALDIVQQDLADTAYLTPRGEAMKVEVKDSEKPDDELAGPRDGARLEWTDAAWKRICRVPQGFMRDMTLERVEQFADGKAMAKVDLELCEEGIAEGRRLMAQMMGDYTAGGSLKNAVRTSVTQPAAPKPEAGAPAWTAEAKASVETAADRAAAAGKFDHDRAAALSAGVAEERAKQRNMDAISQSFMTKLGKQLGYGHPLSELTTKHDFEWTQEAEDRLAKVPDFCREMTRWRVEWTAVKEKLGTTITPEIMDLKFGKWDDVSAGIASKLEWAPEAMNRLENIPRFVRGQVIQSVEGNALTWKINKVDNEVLDRVIAKWIETGDFHEGMYGYKADKKG